MARFNFEKEYDIIVVGGGTGGCSAALTILQYMPELDVCIIDPKKEKDIGDKVCGNLMGKNTINFINDYLHLDYPKEGMITNEINGMDLYSPGGYVVPRNVDAVMIDRHKFGQALIKDAVSAGCKLYDSCLCTGPVIEEDYVCGVEVLDKESGVISTLRSKIVVDASGAGGGFREKVCRNPSFDSSYIKGKIDKKDMSCSYRYIVELKNPLVDAHRGKMILLPELGGYYWVFPENEYVVNVGLGTMCSLKRPNLKEKKEKLKEIMSKDEIFNGSTIIGGGGGVVPTGGQLDSLVDKGIMLVGDAGLQVDPLTGGGIELSIKGGFCCGKVAVDAIRTDDVSQDGLLRYNLIYNDANYLDGINMSVGGSRQRGKDIIKQYVQNLTDKDIDVGFKHLNKSIVSKMISADSNISLWMKVNLYIKTIRAPRLRKIGDVFSLVKEMNETYERYPENPSLFPAWKKEVDDIYTKVSELCA